MNRKASKGLIKHTDFILLDIICLQFSFVLAYWIFHDFANPYDNDSFQYQAVVLMVAQLIVIVFNNAYSGILRRGWIDEAVEVIKITVNIMIFALLYLFAVHTTGKVSRLQFGGTAVIYIVLDWGIRVLNRWRLVNVINAKRSIVLVTRAATLQDDIMRVAEDKSFFLSRIVLFDKVVSQAKTDEIPIYSFSDLPMEEFGRNWTDEVLIIIPPDPSYQRQIEEFAGMLVEVGISVNLVMHIPIKGDPTSMTLRKIGGFKVLSTNLRTVPSSQLFVKRLMDIAGGFIGCIMTGILCIFVGPMIYIKSPGPIFFKQTRIGRGGKPFTMYKFRTMYPDAEARKAELAEKNKIDSGMMFKMDDDPRIIGSEKKDKNGRPKGIGNFLRRYSIDEFPQFYNVLKGDMTLVGWRPCTEKEWEQYNLKHRVRASMKPGITGLWQVSGRSSITDFDEVVRLDREYLENWDLGLDIKIMLKTIKVIVKGEDAS